MGSRQRPTVSVGLHTLLRDDWLYHAEHVNELDEIDTRSNVGVITKAVATP